MCRGREHTLCLPPFAKDMNTPCSLSDALEPGEEPSPFLAAAPTSSLAAGALCGLQGTEKACMTPGEAPAAVPARPVLQMMSACIMVESW